jgi:hypothetical protein
MQIHKQRIVLAVTIVSLLIVGVSPAGATGLSEVGAPAAPSALPPLPEWPIIGPILRLLGLVEEEPEPAPVPVPDPDLPEIRIAGIEDLDQLDGIDAGKSVRVIATEEDVNRMAREILDEHVGAGADLTVDFEVDEVTLQITANTALLEKSGLDIPASVRGDLNIATTLRAGTNGCRPTIEILALRVNRWSIGLRPIAQRALDARLSEVWPSELCVERILLMADEVAVEGYRLP